MYVLCSLGRYHLHLTLTVFALSSALTCAVIVCISHRVDRFYIMSATTMIQICVIITLIIWPPVARHIFMFYIVSASLGVCMALWHTQLLSKYSKWYGQFLCCMVSSGLFPGWSMIKLIEMIRLWVHGIFHVWMGLSCFTIIWIRKE